METGIQTKQGNFRRLLRDHSSSIAAYAGLLLCIILFTVLTPIFGESIWSPSKISTLLSDVIVTALISVGATFVYALGNMDISIGKQVGLYATIMVLMGNATGSLLWGTLISLTIAIVLAFVNGATGEILHIHSIIASVVIMFVLTGVNTMIYVGMGTRNISMKGVDCSIFKSPVFMAIVLVIEILVVTYLFNYTKYGKYAKAIGANPECAKQSGINLIKYKVIAYVVLAFCIILGTLFKMGYTAAAGDSTGSGIEMNVIIALILGGMPLSGGMKSRVSCSVVGAFTFSLLDVGLPLLGINNRVTFIVKAIIFVIVVCITCRKRGGVLPR